MSDYKDRLNNAKKKFDSLESSYCSLWDKSIILWQDGFSLRIIEEITGLSRSKLQRFFAENNYNRVDDVRTQNREERINQASRLYKMGFDKKEIADMMDVNKRTIDAYFKQLGINDRTNFGDD